MATSISFLLQLLTISNGSDDANWQGSSKGYLGDVLFDGSTAKTRTSGTVPYQGLLLTNDTDFSSNPWSEISDPATNPNASVVIVSDQYVEQVRTDLLNAIVGIGLLDVTAGFEDVSTKDLIQNGLDTTGDYDSDGSSGDVIVINITGDFKVDKQIHITGDADDVFVFRWDTDADPSNGFQGQVKFQSGGAIVPHGGLTAGSFIHVAGDMKASGGGSTPVSNPDDAWAYPQGPRDGNDELIDGGKDFSGGGFFTGHWLTTGNPDKLKKSYEVDYNQDGLFTPNNPASGDQYIYYGKTSSFSNAIFVGGWHTVSDKFSLTSGSSGIYVDPTAAMTTFMANEVLPV